MNKIKIIVVDDDLTARNTIKSYLAYDTGYEVVADFSNAKDAILWLRDNEIDIVLCDMQMPIINGIEFIQLLKSIKSDIPVIAVSSFDDFDYLHGCMVNGAADYLLKHELDANALIIVLNKVKQQYNIHSKTQAVKRMGYGINDISQYNDTFIRNLVISGTIDFQLYNILPITISPYYGLGKELSATEYREYQNEIIGAVVDIIGQLLGTQYPYLFYKNSNKNILLLISFKDQSSYLYIKSTVTGIVNRLTRRMIRMLDTTLTIGTGSLSQDLSAAINQSLKLEEMLEDKFYISDNRIFQIETTAPLVYQKYSVPSQIMASLEYELEQKDRESFKKTFHEIITHMDANRPSKASVIKSTGKILALMTARNIISASQSDDIKEFIYRCDTFAQYQNLIINWLDTSLAPSVSSVAVKYSTAVEQSIDYINNNCEKDISLNSCAEYCGISYAHLSREFKKETGQGFVEYLNHVRLSRAKSLLMRQSKSIKEVAALTGFSSYNYFFNVFKKYEGITPAEFVAKNYSL